MVDQAPAISRPAPVRVEAPPRTLRIALAHDWLDGLRGGELVLDRIAGIISREHRPARLYTMFDSGSSITPVIDALDRRVSRVGRLPGASRLRRWLLPLWSRAVESLSKQLERDHDDLSIDLLVSTSSAAIKGMRAPPGVPHLCYCHSPARYVWSQTDEYKRGVRALGLSTFAPRFRRWDRRTAANVTRFLANSRATADLIGRAYDREATVVHPPVRTEYFTPDPSVPREDFWLVAGALEPYKRVDLAIEAAKITGVRLIIAGTGTMERELRAVAGRHARFLGRVSDDELRDLYRRASAMIFPQVEDFGITAVEAQACGCPVVARRAGGALDTVVENKTGVFFDAPDPRELAKATRSIPTGCAHECRANAERFRESVFDDAIRGQIRSIAAQGATAPTT